MLKKIIILFQIVFLPFCWADSGSSISNVLDGSIVRNNNDINKEISDLKTGTSDNNLTQAACSSALSAGNAHSCAIKGSKLYCWGYNFKGQLGIGNQSEQTTPQEVTDLGSGVSAVSAGSVYSCAIKDSKLYCWGYNVHGQLGIGNTTDQKTLQEVTDLGAGVSAVSAGLSHTCAIKDSKLYCWGQNYQAQLGIGNRSGQTTPQEVIGLGSGVSAVSAGWEHTCAIKDSKLYCWGKNSNGELGIGKTSIQKTPQEVTALGSGVSAVSADGHHTCAIKDSKLYCWGANGDGELGIGNTTNQNTPQEVRALGSGVSAMSVGSNHTCALKDSKLYCWGNNEGGQLGLGNSNVDNSPPTVSTFQSLGCLKESTSNLYPLEYLFKIYNTVETCDGVDNNLDGKTDKLFIDSSENEQAVVAAGYDLRDGEGNVSNNSHLFQPRTGNTNYNTYHNENICKKGDCSVGMSCRIEPVDKNVKGACLTDKESTLSCTSSSKQLGKLSCGVTPPNQKKKESCTANKNNPNGYDRNCDGEYNNLPLASCYGAKGKKGKKGLHCNPKGVQSCEITNKKGKIRTQKICVDATTDNIYQSDEITTVKVNSDQLTIANSDLWRKEPKGLCPKAEYKGKQCLESIYNGELYFCGGSETICGKNYNPENTQGIWISQKDCASKGDICCNNWYKPENGICSCNGRDDNCNGRIDEHFKIGKACTVNGKKGTYQCSSSGQGKICDTTTVLSQKFVSRALFDKRVSSKVSEDVTALTPNNLVSCDDNPFKSYAESATDCGTPYSDIDSDSDLVPDYLDECPKNPHKILLAKDSLCGSIDDPKQDSDEDGVPDYLDGCVFNSEKVNYIWPYECGSVLNTSDSDADGVPDYQDECPLNEDKIVAGSCGCEDTDEDENKNGIPDCLDKKSIGTALENGDTVLAPVVSFNKQNKNRVTIRVSYHNEIILPNDEENQSAQIVYKIILIKTPLLNADSAALSYEDVTTEVYETKNPKKSLKLEPSFAYTVYYKVLAKDGENILAESLPSPERSFQITE